LSSGHNRLLLVSETTLRSAAAAAFYALVLGGALAVGSFEHGDTTPPGHGGAGLVCPSLDVRCGVPAGSVDATVGDGTIVIRENGTTVHP
jgi:hypothetical protein